MSEFNLSEKIVKQEDIPKENYSLGLIPTYDVIELIKECEKKEAYASSQEGGWGGRAIRIAVLKELAGETLSK